MVCPAIIICVETDSLLAADRVKPLHAENLAGNAEHARRLLFQ